MKAHRRKGIPTLMLQTGGSTGPSSRLSRFFQGSDIEKQRQRERAAAQRAGLRSILADLPSLIDPLEKGTYDAIMGATKPIRGFQRQGTPFPGQRTQGLNAESYSKGLGDSFVNLGQFSDELKRQGKFAATLSSGETEAATASRKRAQKVAADLRAKIGGELNRANPIAEPVDEFGGAGSLEADILRQAQLSAEASSQAAEASRQEQEGIAPQRLTQAQRAADALSGGVLRPPTTPVEKAKAAQAEQAAETAKASQAAASVSSPEEEALRQATGAPSSAEETAAAAKSGDLSRGASEVQGKDGTTIANIMGSPEAQVDETERLNELKNTFNLNLSDMEKAAPGIAFSLSLMGAQRAPGESVFNALARSAGSAGEGALKAKLALDAKERAIDSSLVSTVLGEKNVAEAYARNKKWTAVWDGGFDKNGVATASFYRMNQRQQDEASAAGIPIVPTEFLGNAMTAVGARAKAGAKLGLDLSKQIAKLHEPKSVDMTFSTSTKPVKGRRLSGRNRQGQTMEVVIPDDVAGTAGSLNTQIQDTAETMGLVGELRGLIGPSTGAFNVGAAAFGKTKAFFNLGKDATSEDFYKKALEEGNVALNNLTGYAKGAVNVDNAYNEMGADGARKLLNLGSELSDDDVKKKLQEHMNNVRGRSKKVEKIAGESPDAYTSRVRFRAIQNALAAQLAPILLGESGRTISDADRVRVITLLGGFSDFSKAGILTTEAEMTQSVNMLEGILGKYNEAALNDANRVLEAYTEASNYESIVQPGQRLYAPSVTAQNAMAELGKSYYTSRPKTNSASAPASTPVTASSIAPAK